MRKVVLASLFALALAGCGPTKPQGSLDDVVALSGGDDVACAHRRDGSTWCWGDTGLTGEGSSAYARPIRLPAVERASAMSAQVCVVLGDRSVACSEAGFGRYNASWPPVPARMLTGAAEVQTGRARLGRVSGLDDVEEVGAGTYIDCARRRDGTVACWGDAAEVLRTGAHDRTRPAGAPIANANLVTDVKGLPPIADISVGASSALAIGDDGSVWTLGGIGRGASRLAEIGDAVEAASGNGYHCVRRRGGAIACWRDGRAPESLSKVDTSPQSVELPPARKIAAGPWGACALLDDGGTACWGGDRLIAATAEASSWLAPQRIAHADGLTDLVVGAFFACGLDRDGGVLCWGDARKTGVGYESPRHSSKAPRSMGWVQLSAESEARALAERYAWLAAAVALFGVVVGLVSSRRLVARATDAWRRLPDAPLVTGGAYRGSVVPRSRASAPWQVRAAIALGLASAGADASAVVVFDGLYAVTGDGNFVALGGLAAAAWSTLVVAGVTRASSGAATSLARLRPLGVVALVGHLTLAMLVLVGEGSGLWPAASIGVVAGTLRLASLVGVAAGVLMMAAADHARTLSELDAQRR